MSVYHILPTLSHGDAVGNDTRALNILLAGMGYRSRIYAERMNPVFEGSVAHSTRELPATCPDDLLIYHFSTGDALNLRFAAMPGKKLMIYHNITPAEFFEPYAPGAAALTRAGYEQAAYLADKVDYCIADSDYNRSELRRMGYACPIDVVPILIPFEDYRRAPDPAVSKKYRDGRTNLLFVGRVAPNKRQEDVIRAFACYQQNYDPEARLFLLGSFDAEDRYYRSLRQYIARLKVRNVLFPGHIRFSEVLAYYAVSDLFLCMSDHEGFCVPLVEAMCFGKPIVAKVTTAVGETMGGGGLPLTDNDPRTAAAAVHRLLTDAPLREAILAAQKRRLDDFGYEKVAGQFRESFGRFLAHVEMTK